MQQLNMKKLCRNNMNCVFTKMYRDLLEIFSICRLFAYVLKNRARIALNCGDTKINPDTNIQKYSKYKKMKIYFNFLD